eukprot:jgi/Chlat1/4143/Chrsp27S04228
MAAAAAATVAAWRLLPPSPVSIHAPSLGRSARSSRHAPISLGGGQKRRDGKQQAGSRQAGVQLVWSGAVRCHAASAAGAVGSDNGHVVDDHEHAGPTLVWFKQDLRLDDHPGFHRALKQSSSGVIPVYCFDPDLLANCTAPTLRYLHQSVAALKASLQACGSDLVVLTGPACEAIPRLARDLGASTIIAEEEAEHSWRQVVGQVEDAVSAEGVKVNLWQLQLFEDDSTALPDNFRERRSVLQPIPSPERLPPLPSSSTDVLSTQLPELSDLHTLAGLTEEEEEASSSSAPTSSLDEYTQVWRSFRCDGGKLPATAQVQTPSTPELAGGEDAGRAALSEYLRFPARATRRRPKQRTQGVSSPTNTFMEVFGPVLALGCLSRRRVFHRATRAAEGWRRARRKAIIPQSVGLPSAQAAAETAECGVFHYWLALRSFHETEQESSQAKKHWRWRGLLTEYMEAGEPGAPCVLLVHGFGAFADHYRKNVEGLAPNAHVFSVTLPGFGRAEKPALLYSQVLWMEFLRDFVLQVVGGPVTIVGNSIGGFMSACLAADCPELVQSVVLLNSAGPIVPGYAPPGGATLAPVHVTPRKPMIPKPMVMAITTGLFRYLEKRIEQTLRRCYPVNPAAVDDFLIEEIFRAACDAGAVGVFASVFYLPQPRPLNFLLDACGKPVLILQGRLDPLNDAGGRAKALAKVCRRVTVHLLDAGHCPHDEIPDVVNAKICEWLSQLPAQTLQQQSLQQQPTPALAA